MKIGFIGFGEASSNIADGLLQQDVSLCVVAFDVNSSKVAEYIKTLACPSRVCIAQSLDNVLCASDVLMVAVPGNIDYNLFEDICRFDVKGKLFIDFCTAKPDDKLSISKIVDEVGAFYVDVAVLGSVPTLKHKVPMMLSGSGALLMKEIFSPYMLDAEIVGDVAGKASLVKLCRSIYMKGLAALSIEMTNVAEAYGVKDLVYASLAKSMDNDEFKNYTLRLISGTQKHLERRTHEVEDCLQLINNSNKQLHSYMTEATLHVYKSIKE